MTHICVGKLTTIGSDNGLSPGRRQAIIWTNAGLLLIGPLGTNFSEILIEILTFSFNKLHLKVSSAKWRPFCLGLNVLIMYQLVQCSAPRHYQDQLGSPKQTPDQSKLKHLEIAFGNVVCEIAAIWFRSKSFNLRYDKDYMWWEQYHLHDLQDSNNSSVLKMKLL